MRSLRAFFMRLFGVFGSTKSDRELSAEIESHLQLHIDDNIRAGMTPAEAKRRAVIALGSVEGTKEAYRDRRGLPAFESLVRDVRYGVRTLIKSPGFAIAGIVILGLGIGVNTAIFTVVNAVVLRPLPFADADRIMRLWHTPPQSTFAGMDVFALSPANFIDWEAQSEVFERMAIYRGGRWTLTGQGEPDAVVVYRGSADLLPILGVSPIDRPRLHAGGKPPGRAAHGAALGDLLAHALRRRSIGDRPHHHAQPPAVHRDRRRPESAGADGGRAGVRAAVVDARRAGDARQSQLSRHREAQARHRHRPRQRRHDRDLEAARGAVSRGQQGLGRAGAAAAGRHDRRRALVADGAARRGGAGAADRVRQSRQPDAGAHARPREGDRGARRARRQPAARDSAVAGRGRGARHRRRAGRICGRVLRRRRA